MNRNERTKERKKTIKYRRLNNQWNETSIMIT